MSDDTCASPKNCTGDHTQAMDEINHPAKTQLYFYPAFMSLFVFFFFQNSQQPLHLFLAQSGAEVCQTFAVSFVPWRWGDSRTSWSAVLSDVLSCMTDFPTDGRCPHAHTNTAITCKYKHGYEVKSWTVRSFHDWWLRSVNVLVRKGVGLPTCATSDLWLGRAFF